MWVHVSKRGDVSMGMLISVDVGKIMLTLWSRALGSKEGHVNRYPRFHCAYSHGSCGGHT